MAKKFKLNVKFDFAASHFLTKYHGKCENLHGHNYKLIVTIEDIVKDDGMVIDYKEIKKTVNENVIDLVDHKHLNDIIENPSSENILIWMWEKLKEKLPLIKLTLYETENYFCEYEGK
ncbi:MAG: 6-carboxytetrahydropterin synthase QueD [Nitrospirae bacterium]|nr:6-carboxytetrahydropterin synthase QueD [Nitrospirota bacterium]